MKKKTEIMQKMRDDRAAQGLKRCEFWLTPEQKKRVLDYVARLNRNDTKQEVQIKTDGGL